VSAHHRGIAARLDETFCKNTPERTTVGTAPSVHTALAAGDQRLKGLARRERGVRPATKAEDPLEQEVQEGVALDRRPQIDRPPIKRWLKAQVVPAELYNRGRLT
jgi:hypothetical protein